MEGDFIISLVSTLGVGTVIGGIVGSAITAWIKNKLDQNSENRRKIRGLREQQYRDFLNNLVGFFEGWENEDFKKQFIWDINANAPVSASDEVYRLARRFLDSFDEQNKLPEPERQKIYAKLVITIRNELNTMSGEPPTDLKEEEITVKRLN